MPPKRVKSSSQSGPTVAAGSKAWEAGLVAAPLEEAGWTACLSLVAAASPKDEEYIQALLRAVQQPQRRLFVAITWDAMLEKISELGNPKAKKPKDVPLFYEVTESAKIIMDAGDELPLQLLGMLVKFLLLDVKGKDLQRRLAEEKTVDETARGKTGTPAKEKGAAAVKPIKGDKGKKAAEVPMPTKQTKLKRRGQEIDDEPGDGPQLYILLLGFYQPQLLSVLDSLGVHVSSIIRLSSEAPELFQGHDTFITGDEALEVQNHKMQKQIDAFWGNLQAGLNSVLPRSRLFDVAQLYYTLKDDVVPLDRRDPEAMLTLGTGVFAGVASLLYDLLEKRKQHQYYLDKLRLISVPSLASMEPQDTGLESLITVPVPQVLSSTKKHIPEELPHATTGVDTRYYCALLESIPTEAQSVPLLLHCMLEQVVAMQEGILLPNRTEAKEHAKGQDILNTKQPKENFGDMMLEQEGKMPLLLNYHDDRSKRLHYVPVQYGMDAMKVEAVMLQNTALFRLLHSAHPPVDDHLRLARLQELMCFCCDKPLSWPEVERALLQFVFESMPLTKTDQDGLLLQTRPPESGPNPWDDPISFSQGLELLHVRPGTSEAGELIQMSEETIRTVQRRRLMAWHYAECHSAAVLAQVLHDASLTYRCMDTFHRQLDRSLCIVCHNPVGPERQSREVWNTRLHTDVGFRRYLEHVADSVSDWMHQEERNWKGIGEQRSRENLCEPPVSGQVGPQEKSVSPSSAGGSLKPLEDVVMDPYVRKDSLKAWKIEQDKLKEEELTKTVKKDKGTKTSLKVQDHSEITNGSKDTLLPSQQSQEDLLKTPEPAMCSRKSSEDIHLAKDEFIGFIGYSMNGTLVHVSGQIQSLFPADGGHIRVETVHFAEGSTFVQVSVTKDNHHFVTHIAEPRRSAQWSKKSTISRDNSECKQTVSKFGSFSTLLSSGIRLSFSHHGSSGESPDERYPFQTLHTNSSVAPPADLSSFTDEALRANKPQSSRFPDWSPFQTLAVSVPTGLVLRFFCEESPAAPGQVKGMLVRQSFPLGGSVSHSLEASRAISSQGTVVRCMRDGSTQILFADGTVSNSPDSLPVCQSLLELPTLDKEQVQEWNPEVKETLEKSGKLHSRHSTGPESVVLADVGQNGREGDEQTVLQQGGTWVTTTPCGFRVATVNAQPLDAQSVLACKAMDPASGAVVVTREDGVLIVVQSDGTIIAEHADGTRITTFYRDIEGAVTKGEEEPCTERKKEKLVMVEYEGFATVVMSCDKTACSAVFGDGTVIKATHRGEYQVVPSSGGFLHIHEDGSTVYTSQHNSNTTLTSGGDNEKLQPGSYVMKHTSEVVCEVTDPEENHFKVMVDGETYIDISRTEDHWEGEEEEGEEEEHQGRNGKGANLSKSSCTGLEGSSARFFVVHPDGSGTELLSLEDVEDFLDKAQADPKVAVLKEAIPEFPGVLGITVLKPCLKDSASRWIVQKQNPDIMPLNLRSRKWDLFPSSESKLPDPSSGTCTSRDPSQNERRRSPLHPPLQACPELLEVRHIIQYQPISSQLRQELERRLKEYMKHLLKRTHLSEELQVKEPREEEERVHAAELLHLVPSLPHMKDLSNTMEERNGSGAYERNGSVDMAALYAQALSPSPPPDGTVADDFGLNGVLDSRKEESLWPGKLEQYRQELREECQMREALRTRRLSPYFHSDISMASQFTQKVPDMEALSQALPPLPRSGPNPQIQEFLQDASNTRALTKRSLKPSASYATGSDAAFQGWCVSPTSQAAEPSCSNGHDLRSEVQMEGPPLDPRYRDFRRQGPQDSEGVSLQGPLYVRKRRGRSLSLAMDVTGSPRKERVCLPPVLLTARPWSLPNHKFLRAEEPVRRTLRTASVSALAGAAKVALRGFELLPTNVDFGMLRGGVSYSVPVIMRNVGLDSCRFSVKQAPPSTGLRVTYQPGPVAAGMKTDLQVQLFTQEPQDPDTEAHLSHQIEILTETEILYLPVSATVLSEKLYDSRVQQDGRRGRMGMAEVQQGVP
ncbi:sperm-associated antigen 17 isoform X2 [Brienomyrus brachyistius]|uniref:sperm-associated antigen 17 isoform X2 n=1 Tax=Brienomyrus brachyistius TaxID=42636 RepID=UPI0020B3D772|nr:sperm-associated antigen 17 isoform X2 [Brienomyrus brachyistius]